MDQLRFPLELEADFLFDPAHFLESCFFPVGILHIYDLETIYGGQLMDVSKELLKAGSFRHDGETFFYKWTPARIDQACAFLDR